MRFFKRMFPAFLLAVFLFASAALGETIDQPSQPAVPSSHPAYIHETIKTGVEAKVIKKKKLKKSAASKRKKILFSRRAIKKTKKSLKKKVVKKKTVKKHAVKIVLPTAAANATAQFNGSVEQQIVDQVNTVRNQNGLSSLKIRSDLQNFARQWSLQQYDNGGMSHGMLTFPRKSIAGQNVAYAEGDVNYFGWEQIWSAQATMDSWMNSPEHRANILNRQYKYIGVGVVYGEPSPGSTDGWAFFTQDFSN
ncbi:MAG: CAP domain-containing protein [Sporolactobacillus sp.]